VQPAEIVVVSRLSRATDLLRYTTLAWLKQAGSEPLLSHDPTPSLSKASASDCRIESEKGIE